MEISGVRVRHVMTNSVSFMHEDKYNRDVQMDVKSTLAFMFTHVQRVFEEHQMTQTRETTVQDR